MKKTILISTFLAVGAGSAGVSALNIQGSDTLKEFTLSVINAAVCPGATSLVYLGGGSGTGESAMALATPTQAVAPMSRFLQVGGATPNLAEGVAFAADGITISVSKRSATCDPNAITGTTCTAQAGGFRQSGTLPRVGGTYTLGAANVTGWRDVLRLVFFGIENTTAANPAATDGTKRNCAGAVRKALVNSYGELFEDASCTTGTGCTQLTHAWRRDNYSGTTDVFRELTSAKLYPFCSNRFAADPVTYPPATDATVTYPNVLGTGAALYDDAYQDFDPIRRPCAGGAVNQGAFLPAPTNNGTVQPPFPSAVAEQVCGPLGTLGLVLPIRAPVNKNGDIAVNDVFPTKPCLRGTFNFGPAPKLPGSATRDTLCPNGNLPLGTPGGAAAYNPTTGQVVGSTGVCLIPSAADGDSQCINGRNNLPAIGLDAPNPALIATDGRVYNLHMYGPGSTPTYKTDTEVGQTPNPGLDRQVVGNYIRIHSTRTLIATGPTCPGTSGNGRCCDKLDSTDQIGCLANADACSVGFSGRTALDQTLATSGPAPEGVYGASLGGVRNAQTCIADLSYVLSRKVFITSIPGFENATAAEKALAICFSGNVAGVPTASPPITPAQQFASLLSTGGLFPLTAGPACQTFVAGSGACGNNPVGIAP